MEGGGGEAEDEDGRREVKIEAEVADAKARRVMEGLLKVKDEASDDRRVTTIARR